MIPLKYSYEENGYLPHSSSEEPNILPPQSPQMEVPRTCACWPRGLMCTARWRRASGIYGSPARPCGRDAWGCCCALAAWGPPDAFSQYSWSPVLADQTAWTGSGGYYVFPAASVGCCHCCCWWERFWVSSVCVLRVSRLSSCKSMCGSQGRGWRGCQSIQGCAKENWNLRYFSGLHASDRNT